MNAFSETDCARARESVSAELDGELPELELQWQRAHLRDCRECSAWAELVRDATLQLREARLEEPVLAFALPRRARRLGVSPAIAVASAAAVAASVVFGIGPRHAVVGGNTGRQQPRTVALGARTVPSLLLDGRRLGPGSPSSAQASSTTDRLGRFRAS